MSQSLAVPTTRLPSIATKASPSAADRPSRSLCELLRQRWPPKASSSSASRAATSGGRSFLIEIILRRAPAPARSDARSKGGAVREWEGPAQPAPAMSDVIGLQRREAVERHRGVGCRIGAGPLDQHLVTDLKADREHVGLLLVQHVGRVTGRAREHTRCQRVAVPRGADRVADRLVHGFGETAEFADVEIDPADIVLFALLGDEDNLGFDGARIADQATARLDDGLRNPVAEVLAQRLEDRVS